MDTEQKTKHSHEPWSYYCSDEEGDGIFDDEGKNIIGYNNDNWLDDHKRIVACINACRDVPNEILEDIITMGLAHRAANGKEPAKTQAVEILKNRKEIDSE